MDFTGSCQTNSEFLIATFVSTHKKFFLSSQFPFFFSEREIFDSQRLGRNRKVRERAWCRRSLPYLLHNANRKASTKVFSIFFFFGLTFHFLVKSRDVGFKSDVTKQDIEKMKSDFKEFRSKISFLLESLPRDLLLVLRTT